jgi:hypothetical protein
VRLAERSRSFYLIFKNRSCLRVIYISLILGFGDFQETMTPNRCMRACSHAFYICIANVQSIDCGPEDNALCQNRPFEAQASTKGEAIIHAPSFWDTK